MQQYLPWTLLAKVSTDGLVERVEKAQPASAVTVWGFSYLISLSANRICSSLHQVIAEVDRRKASKTFVLP